MSRSQEDSPHILIITEIEGEKEWDVEHPESCPVACPWFPPENGYANDRFPMGGDPRQGERLCLTQYELDTNGIDSLHVVVRREKQGDQWVDVAPHADPNYTPATPFEAEWKRLPPGRYEIQVWYQSGEGMGEYGGMGDPDSGIQLLRHLPEESACRP